MCGTTAKRTHSHYVRTLADLPWGEHAVAHRLRVRRMFCDNARCDRRVFTERLPGVAEPWARRTERAAGRLTSLGLAVGGAAGRLGLPASRNTLLSLIRRAPLPEPEMPIAVGVDDWAVRKRHRYGTVLVDLEQRRPIALLPDRHAEPLAAWLREHPGVQVIARDRAYARGARAGAPGAIQVADRFHLLQNLGTVLEAALAAHARTLRAAAGKPSAPAEAIVIPPREVPQRTRVSAETGWQRRRRVHEQVWALRREGIAAEEIAGRLGVGRATVFRHLRQERFPHLARRADAGRSSVDHWADLVLARWNAGQRHGRRLYREVQEEGYRGSYASLVRYLKRLRQASGVAPRRRAKAQPVPTALVQTQPLTPRAVAWLVLCRPEKRKAAAGAVLDRLRAHSPSLREIIEIAEAFADLVRNRAPERLDPWLRRAQDSPVAALRRFAEGLLADYDAARAAVTLPWSNGSAEGQINRLKMLKRQMYGRAGIDLLAKRFLSAA